MITESKENDATTTIVTLLHGAKMNTEDEIVIETEVEKKTATTIGADRFRRRLTNAGLAMIDTKPPQSTIEGALRSVKT